VIKKSLAVLTLFALLFSCQSVGNLESEYEGHELSKPIDLDKLKGAIQLGLLKFNWKILSESGGKFIAKYEKSHGTISATIEVNYSREGYSIKYVDSKNLDADLERMKIHPNFVRWIRNLNKSIAENYYQATM
jgi:hypothetical protein